MIHNYPYLQDSFFLQQFDKEKVKEKYVKINVLTFQSEELITSIESQVLNGNINMDGSSSMRRTANLNLIVRDSNYTDFDIRKLLTLNKKIEILVGFKNTMNQYLDYPILWFPQGVFVIMDMNLNQNTDGISISLTLHDKMALLNGQCGGTFPATVIFHQVEDISPDGEIYIRNPTIYQIIQELVNHFGNEDLNRIIISDLEERIKKVMKWTGSTPLYLKRKLITGGGYQNTYSTNYNQLNTNMSNATITQFSYGQDVGYIYSDFIYPGELIGNAGENVVTILDKIKNLLGNYEYFYDIEGNFRFQEIKNNLNTTYTKNLIDSINQNDYLVDYSSGRSIYNFNDANIIQSYSNNPQLQLIKNDFVVWGKRKSAEGLQIPIRYHLAIDHKPYIGHTYEICLYEDEDGLTKAGPIIKYANINYFPKTGLIGVYYYANNSGKNYLWNPKTKSYDLTAFPKISVQAIDYRTELYLQGVVNELLTNIVCQANTIFETTATSQFPRPGLRDVLYYDSKNKRLYIWNDTLSTPNYQEIVFAKGMELYLQEIVKESKRSEKNYYYAELKNEWTKLYDIQEQNFLEEAVKDPSGIDFFLDILDVSSELAEFSIQNIGRRTLIINDDTINCIFEPDNPDIILIQSGTEQTDDLRTECQNKRQEYCQVSSNIYNLLANGGVLKSAYQEIRKELYLYTNYNQQVSLTVLPIYYLEPNNRITINNQEVNLSGDYMINSISLPLGIGETMTITCSKILERI